jgi:hypothetical protein
MAKDNMTVEKTSTGAIIHEPTLEVKRKALQYFSLPDPQREYFIYSGSDINKKPIFGHEHDVLYISSGFLKIKDPVIDNLRLRATRVTSRDGAPIEIEMNRKPRSQLQVDCIQMMVETGYSKMTCEVKPGVDFRHPYRVIGM